MSLGGVALASVAMMGAPLYLIWILFFSGLLVATGGLLLGGEERWEWGLLSVGIFGAIFWLASALSGDSLSWALTGVACGVLAWLAWERPFSDEHSVPVTRLIGIVGLAWLASVILKLIA
jgi:hypothetical protein